MNLTEPDISIVSPCFNEEENIITFIESVNKNLTKISKNYEIIIVDDGSTDNTWSIINEIKLKYGKKLKAIKFTRNFGHQKALICGIRKASGNKILTMDSDLQHPPNLIPSLYKELLKDEYDIISCTRIVHSLSIKYFFSNIFYYFFNIISKNKIKKNVSDFKIFKKDIKNALESINEKNLFLRGVIPWLGYKEKTITYKLEKRKKGESKLGFKHQLSFSFDAIFGFSFLPRRFSFYISFLFFLLFIILLFIGVTNNFKLINDTFLYFTFLFVVLVLFSIFLGLGIVTEYLARILEQTQNRPDYVIKKEI